MTPIASILHVGGPGYRQLDVLLLNCVGQTDEECGGSTTQLGATGGLKGAILHVSPDALPVCYRKTREDGIEQREMEADVLDD